MGRWTLRVFGGISASTRAEDRPDLLQEDGVQDLLLYLAPRPVPLTTLHRTFPHMKQALEQLLYLTALRVENGQVCINFPLTTRDDTRLLLAACEQPARSLAGRLLDHRPVLRRLLASFPLPHVSHAKLAFMVVGCYFLDLTCLRLLQQEGYVAGPRQMPGGNSYIIMMDEPAPESALEGVYWGCHQDGDGTYAFNTFGDHAPNTRRLALPDVIWASVSAIPASLPLLRRAAGAHLMSHVAGEAGALLESAWPGGLPAGGDEPMRGALTEMGYLREVAGRLHIITPVFTTGETQMIASLFEVLKPVAMEWMGSHFSQMGKDLAGITCLRHGVSFHEAMIEIWHYVFGLANRSLAEAGLFFDTYKEEPARPGYLPGVFPSEWLHTLFGWAE